MSAPAVTSPRRLRLQVRDADLRMVAPVDHYLDAELVPKFNPVSKETCGTFVITLPLDLPDSLGGGRNPAALALRDPGSGVVASLDGQRFFSGVVDERTTRRAGKSRTHLEVFGYSDELFLAKRNAWPVPGSDDLAAQDAQAYDLRVAVAEVLVKQYVDAGAGPAAPAARRVPALVVDPVVGAGLGAVIPGRARFTNMAELVSDACSRGGGLGWRVVQVGGALRFQVFMPRDRTKHARFSPALRNLTDYELKTTTRSATRVVAAGGGQGVDRLFRQAQVPVPWWEYSEVYLDRRDAGGGAQEAMTAEERAEAVAELDLAAADELAKGARTSTFTGSVQDTPLVGFLRPDDEGGYGPLDRVTVSVDGVPFKDVVRQVSVKSAPGRLSILPTVGVPEQDPDSARIRDLERRLANLERS